MPKHVNQPTKEKLDEWYSKEGLSTRQIAKKCGVDKKTVLKWLREYGVKIRNTKTAKLEVKGIILPSKEELEIDSQSLSLHLLAKKYRLSVQSIITLQNKFSIQRRTRSEARRLALGKNRAIPWNKGLNKNDPRVVKSVSILNRVRWGEARENYNRKLSNTQKRQYAEGARKVWNDGLTKEQDHRVMESSERLRQLRIGKDPWNKKELPQKEILIDLYINQNKSLSEIAILFETNQSTVMRWLAHYQIERRKPFSGRKGISVRCKDGTMVRSSFERQVADWLFEHHIPYQYNAFYIDKNQRKNEWKRFQTDFKIDDRVYIEVIGASGTSKWALKDREEYFQKRDWLTNGTYLKKTGKNVINLVEIFPKSGHLSKKQLDKALLPVLNYYQRKNK